MAGPAYRDIPVYHGDTLKFALVFNDADVDLTGHVAKFQIRKAGVLVADWSEFVTITNPKRVDVIVPGDPDPDGTMKPPRPPRMQNYDYDLQLTAPSGNVRTPLRGLIPLMGDVSHD
jgi:hypothetical protein